jgi:hypothetical protein
MNRQQNKAGEMDRCCLCQRQVPLTFHHLIPKKVHRRTYFKKHFTQKILAKGILVCRKCHKGIHGLHDEMTLARIFNSLEKLRNDPDLLRHVEWVARQKS